MSHPDQALATLLRTRPLNIAILLFPEVEVLDFAGPFEVFSVASRIASKPQGHAPFTVFTVAAERTTVIARHGLKVIPEFGFSDRPAIDLLIVPGGVVTQPLADEKTIAWIGATAATAPLTASVCTGAFLLARAGLLRGHRATTHWEDIADLRAMFPGLTIVENVPFVDEGAIVTSAGISAGIEMSLHLVGRILGIAAARATARQMQYDWQESALPAIPAL